MKSPLVQVILSTLGGFVIILLVLETLDWVNREFPQPPVNQGKAGSVHYPFYHDKANDSLERFNLLSDLDQRSIRENIVSSLITMEQWLALLNKQSYEITCIGELHDEQTRIFLADEFFSRVKADALLLETTPDGLQDLTRRMESDRSYFPLLNADILNILRTVRSANADIRLHGIEQTPRQKRDQHPNLNSREKAIARNFWKVYRPGKRHLVLFGNLHCAKEPGWLFHELQKQAPAPLMQRMLSVTVLGEHQKGPVEAFVYFLHEIGINAKDFVIPELSSLHPFIVGQFKTLNNQVFTKYDTLIVFTPRNRR